MMAPPPLSYGLNLAPKKGPGKPTVKGQAGQKRKKTIFDSDSDDEESGATKDDGSGAVEIGSLGGLEPEPSSSNRQPPGEPLPKRRASEKQAQPPKPEKRGETKSYVNLSSLHSSNKHAETAASIDSSIYDYDAIYDSIHPPKKNTQSGGADGDASSQGPKYMTSLLRSAEVRKRDQLRARDKLLAREREAEGDEFADKDKFVTAAYKEQQEEVRRVEAEEAEKEKEEEERRKKGMGMASFYKDMLERDGKQHEEAMKAAAEATTRKQEAGEDGTEEADTAPQEKSAAQIAAEKNAQGAHIVTNEEGEVVDKRQLLSAGLNVSAKPKPKPAPERETAGSRVSAGRPADRGAATSGRNMQRARQTEMLTSQLETRMQKEQEEEEARMKAVAENSKSKKTDTDVMSAKERYLARKREREQQAKE